MARPALEAAGYSVSTVPTGEPALKMLTHLRPDVVVADVPAGESDGFELLRRLRSVPAGQAVPVILLTDADADILTGLRLGADDCVARPLSPDELVARVSAKTARPPVPADLLSRDLRTGLLDGETLLDEADRELARAGRVGRPGALGVVRLQERPALVARFGSGVPVQLAEQLADLLRDDPVPLERLGRDGQGHLLVLLPETRGVDVEQRLAVLAAKVAATRFTVNGESVRVTPITAWADFAEAESGDQLYERARTALAAASGHLDLLPVRWTPAWTARSPPSAPAPRYPRGRAARPAAAAGADPGHVRPGDRPAVRRVRRAGAVGMDVSGVAYWCVMAALLVTAAAIWVEGFFALDPLRPPDEPGAPYPTATAVIAAYLPNEAATILETVEAFQRVDYPGDLQIIVAYNTPHPDGGRGRAAGDRAAGPAHRAAQGRGQHLEGAERQRRDEPRPRRVRRHVRRRPPPGPGRVQAGLALAVQRLRRGPGPLRDPQRRRLPGRADGRRRVRGHLRGQPPRPRRAARLRRLRRLQRLLAHRPAGPDPDARLDADRGHRLHACGCWRPAPGSPPTRR